jgi:uncharacterized membrane protein
MNEAEVHLALNHLPLFGTLFGFLLLLLAVLRKSRDLKQAGLWLCLLAALGAIPVYLSGEPAEELVESVPGVNPDLIEEHEESALWALVGIEILGAASLAGLYLSRKTGGPPERLIHLCLVLALIAVAIVGRTAYLGGQIHHPEVRPGFQAMLMEPSARHAPA